MKTLVTVRVVRDAPVIVNHLTYLPGETFRASLGALEEALRLYGDSAFEVVGGLPEPEKKTSSKKSTKSETPDSTTKSETSKE